MSVINAVPLLAAAGGDYQISRSVRLRSSASAYFNRTPASASNRKLWTWSGWVKRGALGGNSGLFSAVSGLETLDLAFEGNTGASGDTLRFVYYTGAALNGNLVSTPVYRDPSAWYHIVAVWDTDNATAANRMRLYVNGVEITSFGTSSYPSSGTSALINNTVAHSLGRYSNSSRYFDGYLTEVNFIDGQALTPSSFGETDTITGVWKPKKYGGTYGTNGFYLNFSDNSDVVNLGVDQRSGAYSAPLRTQGTVFGGFTTAGGNAAAFDGNTDQAGGTSAAAARAPAPASGYTSASAIGRDWGAGVTRTITAFRIFAPNNGGILGLTNTGIGYKLQGSNDGTSYTDLTTATTTAGTTGEVITVTAGITTSTAYRYHRVVFNGDGANNLYLAELQFFEAGSLGLGNNWYPNNISVTSGVTYDSMLDVPTPYADGGNGRGNYAVLNPLKKPSTSTITDGNLNVTWTTLGGEQPASFAQSSGKWYWEQTQNGSLAAPGIILDTAVPSASSISQGYHYYGNTGQFYTATTGVAYGATFTTGDVIGVALDLDNNQITFYKNNVSQGTKTIAAGSYNPDFASGGTITINANFGQRPFAYTPPSGFKALNTQNLPSPTISNGANYMNVALWSGASTGTQIDVTSYAFQPDLIWSKTRNNAYDHYLQDAVRGIGVGATNTLSSNLTSAETNTSGLATAFLSNGFRIGSSALSTSSGNSLVTWGWKESATAGFDIVTYTGTGANRTIAHSLGVAPKMVVVKARNLPNSIARPWAVWHTALSSTEVIFLNDTAAKSTGATTYWNSTLPTSSVFSVGTEPVVNGATGTVGEYVAYLFSEVAGFSKFGSYTGNGSSDGVFVHLGFRARYLLIKETGNANSWEVYDTARNEANVQTKRLFPNDSLAEATTDPSLDILSNGFKCRAGNTGINRSGGTYIYAAFAENPFKNALAR